MYVVPWCGARRKHLDNGGACSLFSVGHFDMAIVRCYEQELYHSHFHIPVEVYRKVDSVPSTSVWFCVFVWPYETVWLMDNQTHWFRDMEM